MEFMNPHASKPAAPPPPSDQPSSGLSHVVHSPVLARVIVAGIVILVPAMVGQICFRSATFHEPTTAVVVTGDPSLDGATVDVVETHRTADARSWDVTLTRDNGWRTPFILHPGDYRLRVSLDGHQVMQEDFSLDPFKGIGYDLPSLVLFTGPASMAGAQINVVRTDVATPALESHMVLPDDHHHRVGMYLSPGEYELSVRNHGESLLRHRFTVTHEAPLRIDLAKALEED